MRTHPTRHALCAGLCASVTVANARAKAATSGRWFVEDGVAIRGTEPVACSADGRRMAGRAAFTHAWQGGTWRCATAANRGAFAADPARCAPARSGFCAWAVAEGYTAPIDPAAWWIVQGRLYLNYNRTIQRRWDRDIAGSIRRAETNWPRLAAR